MNIDKSILSEENFKKLENLKNGYLLDIIEKYINILKPSKVTVISDTNEDFKYIREMTVKNNEEKKLAMEGHTAHFDGYYDQGRDKDNTRVLINPDMKMSKVINTMDREKGLNEILGVMNGIMKGKEAIIMFFCLGPLDSKFSLCAFQITDSFYVSHSGNILYRPGYEQFKKLTGSKNFFSFIHSSGELDKRGNSKNVDKRRIFIDLKGNIVLTMNNQYAGNSLGLKKLGLRLSIYKSNNEDWLTEHMFIMGIKPQGKNRTTYFSGAYPSACGKTSTAMVPGQTIIGDDIAYIKKGADNNAYAVNIEQGIFGIITDVNPVDDPYIYEVLTTPRELIFSNILINNGVSYWINMGKELPEEGINYFSDTWKIQDKDKNGKQVGPAHKNARYTVRLSELENVDKNLDNPDGVKLQGILYGGRDSDTSVPVYESFNWEHGVFVGASIESETTAATIGKEGVREFSPMANLDFLVVSLGKYINNHFKFGNSLKEIPRVFATNYFLKENEKFLNEKLDKKIWLLWAEGRVYDEYDAIETPIGYIPKYEDLKILFKKEFNKEYSKEQYVKQFSIRVTNFLTKMERIKKLYTEESDIPEKFIKILKEQEQKLLNSKNKYKKDIVSPFEF